MPYISALMVDNLKSSVLIAMRKIAPFVSSVSGKYSALVV